MNEKEIIAKLNELVIYGENGNYITEKNGKSYFICTKNNFIGEYILNTDLQQYKDIISDLTTYKFVEKGKIKYEDLEPNTQKLFKKEFIGIVKNNVKYERLRYTYSATNKKLIELKEKIEPFYQIVVNEDNKKEKYYFNYEINKYKLLDKFALGYLLEKNHDVILTESEVTTLLGMFRNVQKPKNSAIAFNNIVLDTKTFKPISDNTFTVKQIPYNYLKPNETVKNTLTENTLKEILINSNPQKADNKYYNYFLETVGASLKPVNIHKLMIMFKDDGNGGKSIIIKILKLLHRDLAVNITPNQLTDQFNTINLANTNVLLMDELHKDSFKEPEKQAIIKNITGGGQNDSRNMHSQDTTIAKDYGLIFIATNTVPQVPYSNTAYWKRLQLIKLSNTFIEELEIEDLENNKLIANEDLASELEEDVDGIEWLISTCIEAYKKAKNTKFSVNQSAIDTQLINDKGNVLKAFITNYIVDVGDKEVVLTNFEIKYMFLKYCIKNNITVDALTNVVTDNDLAKEIGIMLKDKFGKMDTSRKTLNNLDFDKIATTTVYRSLAINLDIDITIEEMVDKYGELTNYYFDGEI